MAEGVAQTHGLEQGSRKHRNEWAVHPGQVARVSQGLGTE